MTLKSMLEEEFNYLVTDYNFKQDTNKLTNINYQLCFKKGNVGIIFYIEEMESYFGMEVVIKSKERLYSISENPIYFEQLYKLKTNISTFEVCFKNIFIFTDNKVKESIFKKMKEENYKKIGKLFTKKKILNNIVRLYSNLLLCSLSNIFQFEQQINESSTDL